MTTAVQHKEAENRFELTTPDGVAVVDYSERGDSWSIHHTFVPPQMRGQGVAAAIVKHALDEARARGKKVFPACSYVEAYIARHSQYKDLLE